MFPLLTLAQVPPQQGLLVGLRQGEGGQGGGQGEEGGEGGAELGLPEEEGLLSAPIRGGKGGVGEWRRVIFPLKTFL